MIQINNNKFEEGDEITLLTNETILHGKIHILDDQQFYILHNNFSYYYDDKPIKSEYKYAWFFSLEYEPKEIILHKVDINSRFKYLDEHIHRGLLSYLSNQPVSLSFLFNLELPSIVKYDEVTESKTQGSIELHSGERKKKLTVKLARFVGKLIREFNEKLLANPKNNPFKFLDKDIEKLHNGWMAAHPTEVKYELLTGEDILKGYTSKNYCSDNGTIHNSCMADKFNFLKLYTKNPEKISLLVFYDNNESDKIAGRTLIWKADDDKLYFDRIYYTHDWYELVYENLCKDLGYLEARKTKDLIKIKLNNLDFRRYPYVDTFNVISFKDSELYNAFNLPENLKFKYTLKTQTGHILEENSKITDLENV